MLFLAIGAKAGTTNLLSDAEMQGRQLAQQLRDGRPAENFTNAGVLKIRDDDGGRREVSFECKTIATPADWRSVYVARSTNESMVLVVIHIPGRGNTYFYSTNFSGQVPLPDDLPTLGRLLRSHPLPATELMAPFAGSDFWVADLGLEFFHWPQQQVLPHPTNLKLGRSYTLLESTNPDHSTNGYARVLSWIDKETGGILEAEAYDAQGRLLKDFAPKSFKKVDGQWQLQQMEIRNVQTGSRTRLEFDLTN